MLHVNQRFSDCSVFNLFINLTALCFCLPSANEKISISIGIAIYKGIEKNYSELFKKADIALYKSKADSNKRFYISGEN